MGSTVIDPQNESPVRAASDGSPPYLLVPMAVEAMMVSDGASGSFRDFTPRYRALLNSGAMVSEFAPATGLAETPKPGIHLHWRLPDGFLHLDSPVAGGEKLTGRPAPNRWLVTRLTAAGAKPPSFAHWAVESDSVAAGEDKPEDPPVSATLATVPQKPDGDPRLEVRRIGVRKEVASDKTHALTDTAEASALTAQAPGNPGFHAFYPSCASVFGFFDSAEKLTNGATYSYLVTGWFSHAASDPLFLEGVTARAEKIAQYGWMLPEGQEAPKRLLCFGAVCGLIWDDSGAKSEREAGVGARDAAGAPLVKAVLGSSMTDAVATALNARLDQKERDSLVVHAQFCAFAGRPPAHGASDNESHVSGLGMFLEARAHLHRAAFQPHDGGQGLKVEWADAESSQGSPKLRPPVKLSKEESETLSAAEKELSKLAAAQAALAGLRRDWTAVRAYGDYVRSNAGALFADANALTSRCDAHRQRIKAEIEATIKTVRAQAAEVERRTKALSQMIANNHPGARLASIRRPRYWEAVDPYLVLVSDAPLVAAMQGGRRRLVCRTSAHGVADTALCAGPAGRDALKAIAVVNGLAPPLSLPNLIEAHRALLVDVMLLDRSFAECVSDLPMFAGLGEADGKLAGIAAAVDELETGNAAQAAAALKRLGDYLGLTEAAADDAAALTKRTEQTLSLISGFNLRRQNDGKPQRRPQPVYLYWKAKTQPLHRSAGAKKAGFAPVPSGIEAHHTDGALADQEHIVSGFTPLVSDLHRRLPFSSGFQLSPEQTLVLLGQSLSGLCDQLAMQDGVLRLPPFSLERPSSSQDGGSGDDQAGIIVRDADAVTLLGVDADPANDAAAPRRSPLPPSPLILAGDRSYGPGCRKLTLIEVDVVDQFGCRHQVDFQHQQGKGTEPNLLYGRGLRGGPDREGAVLPPRLPQAARLPLVWRSAGGGNAPSRGDAETSPVAGWVVHHRPQQGLAIYNGGGEILGLVQAVADSGENERARWLPFSADATTVADIANPYLRRFVAGLVRLTENGPNAVFAAFRAFLSKCDGMNGGAVGQGLIGGVTERPLALVRASVGLELMEPPFSDLAPWRHDGSGKPPAYELSLELRLGDRRIGPDGVIGCFLNDGDAAWNTMIPAVAPAHDPASQLAPYLERRKRPSVLWRSDSSTSSDVDLTLLMDPRLPVHVVSGVMPVEAAALPQDLTRWVMENLQLSFLSAPVMTADLGGGSDPAKALAALFPLPSDNAKEWSWLRHAPGQQTRSEIPISADQRAAPSLAAPVRFSEGWLIFRPQTESTQG